MQKQGSLLRRSSLCKSKPAERGWIDGRNGQRWIGRIICAHVLGGKLAIYSKLWEVLERELQLLREMGLAEGRRLALKMPEGSGVGRLGILVGCLERIAWLSVRGTGRQREPARGLLERILCAASAEGRDACGKAKKAVDRVISRSPQRCLEKEVGSRVVRIGGGRRGSAEAAASEPPCRPMWMEYIRTSFFRQDEEGRRRGLRQGGRRG